MQEPDLIDLFIRPLHRGGAKYLVAGSLGSSLYGEPRLTVDVDVPILLSDDQLAEFANWFPEPEYYCPPAEILAVENKRECRSHFNVIHIASGLKADFYPAHQDEFFSWSFAHRRTVNFGPDEVFYAPPEYIIVWKVAYFAEGHGEKHIRDIRRMLELAKSEIDQPTLEAELTRRGLTDAYAKITAL